MAKTVTDAAPLAAKTAKPVLLVRRGRGRLGGSTFLDAMVQDARDAGRNPIIADAARNPTLSTLYPDVSTKPRSEALGDKKDWLSEDVMSVMVDEGRSCGLDMGGGQDDTLDDYGRDLDLIGFCDRFGVLPVAAYLLGPDMDDFDHALKVRRLGSFAPKQELIVMNEGALRRGEDPEGAFGRIKTHPDFIQWVKDGARPIYMTNLACLAQIRELGLTISQAERNMPNAAGKKIGQAKAFMVEDWRRKIRREIADVGAQDWVL